jgi:hypothetical protein
MKIRLIAVGLLALSCVSCTATLNRKQPWGEKLRVTSRSDPMKYRDVELLAVDDSMLYSEDHGLISSERWDQVRRVRVLAYGSQRALRWLCWMPTLALGIYWFVDVNHPNNRGEAAMAAAVTAFTGLIMYATAPHSTFGSPPSARDREYLRLFARYPQGLTEAQWQDLLHAHGQRDFIARP